ncbi:MAG: mannose-1-phosphate guanylyltransferase [Aquificota bacterium]|nr:MAG: mannose-1-phosphate guanylyltransferase [Aquificota bacterium]
MERVAVIMAGGGGVRLWPLSNPQTPKHMLPLFSQKSLLKETIERIAPFVGSEKVLIVTTRDMAIEVAKEGDVPRERVIVEPRGRNTAPAVALSTLYVMNILGEEAIIIVLPADHHIEPPEALWSCLDKASKLALDGWLVTLGIPPTRPETGYGYMETGEMLIPSALRVRRFTEKPSLEKAQKFLEEGNYYWNSGIFIWKAQTLWEELVRHLPEVALPLDKFRNTAWKVTVANLEALYSRFPNISIDHAVMEKSQRVAMVPANFQWCDVGSWASLWEILEKDHLGNVSRGLAQILETQDSLIWSQDIPVKVLGLNNLVVVATPQGVLVCPMEKSQEIKKLFES